jgi:hypothetical protein
MMSDHHSPFFTIMKEDADGKADPAVFRPATAQWFILR